jgi:hypothetical protein
MASLFFIRFIKMLMVTTPFLAMTLMLLALWGVGGKTTYSDLSPIKAEKEITIGEAKNYLVNEIKSHESPSAEMLEPKICGEEKNATPAKQPTSEKIDWEQVV